MLLLFEGEGGGGVEWEQKKRLLNLYIFIRKCHEGKWINAINFYTANTYIHTYVYLRAFLCVFKDLYSHIASCLTVYQS